MSSIKPIRNEKNFYLMNIGNNIINLGKPPIPVEILDGPIFTEIRQDFSPNAALVTRVFKASNRILRRPVPPRAFHRLLPAVFALWPSQEAFHSIPHRQSRGTTSDSRFGSEEQ